MKNVWKNLNEIYTNSFENRLNEMFERIVEGPKFGQKAPLEKDAKAGVYEPLRDAQGKVKYDAKGSVMYTSKKIENNKEQPSFASKAIEDNPKPGDKPKPESRRQQMANLIQFLKQEMPSFKKRGKLPSTDADERKQEWLKNSAKAVEIIRKAIEIAPERLEKSWIGKGSEQENSRARREYKQALNFWSKNGKWDGNKTNKPLPQDFGLSNSSIQGPEWINRVEKYIVNETIEQASRTFGQIMADLLADIGYYFIQKHPGANVASPGAQYFTSKNDMVPIQAQQSNISGVKEAIQNWAADEFKRSASELPQEFGQKLSAQEADEILRRVQQKAMSSSTKDSVRKSVQPVQKEPNKNVKGATEKELSTMKDLAKSYLPDHFTKLGKSIWEHMLKEAEDSKIIGGTPKIGGKITGRSKLSPEEEKASKAYQEAFMKWKAGGSKGEKPTPEQFGFSSKKSETPPEQPKAPSGKENANDFIERASGQKQNWKGKEIRAGKPVPDDEKPNYVGIAHNIEADTGAQFKKASMNVPDEDVVDAETGKHGERRISTYRKVKMKLIWNAYIQDWVDESTQDLITKNNNKLLPDFVAEYKAGTWFPYTEGSSPGKKTGDTKKGSGKNAPMLYWDNFDEKWILPEMWEEFKKSGYKPFKVPGHNTPEAELVKKENIDGKDVTWTYSRMLKKWRSPEQIQAGKEGAKYQDVKVPKELESPPAREGKRVGETIWTPYTNTDTGKEEDYPVWAWTGDKHKWVRFEKYQALVKSGEVKPEPNKKPAEKPIERLANQERTPQLQNMLNKMKAFKM
jgi:hypothetical protein